MEEKLGATGKFPKGKLNKDDEGELAFAVFINKGYVIVEFGTPVQWCALDKNTAELFAKTLLRNAAKLKC